MSCIAFYKKRIENITLIIEAYEAAIIALTIERVKSYDLDTGQTKTRVTKIDIPDMQNKLEEFIDMVCRYQKKVDDAEAGLGGGDVIQMMGCW